MMHETYLAKIRNTQNKTYCVQNVRFATAIESCDSIELFIKPVYLNSFAIGFESFQYHRFDIHFIRLGKRHVEMSRCDIMTRFDTTTVFPAKFEHNIQTDNL